MENLDEPVYNIGTFYSTVCCGLNTEFYVHEFLGLHLPMALSLAVWVGASTYVIYLLCTGGVPGFLRTRSPLPTPPPPPNRKFAKRLINKTKAKDRKCSTLTVRYLIRETKQLEEQIQLLHFRNKNLLTAVDIPDELLKSCKK